MQFFWHRTPLYVTFAIAALVVGITAGIVFARHRGATTSTPPPAQIARPSAAVTLKPSPASEIAPASESSQRLSIPRHSTFIAALAPYHLDAALVHQLVDAARPVYNLARVQAGHDLNLERSPTGAPDALSYEIDSGHILWLRAPAAPLAADSSAQPASWTASIQIIPFVVKLAGISGNVESSLFQAVEAAGEHDMLAVDLANIFGWDLDFYTDTRPGDVFRVLVEKRYRNGQFAGYGQIVAAEYVNAGKAYDALRFHDDLGYLAYYEPNGRPMKREFLRSPLKFDARVTSSFSLHRWHPILKVYRAHLGTDFAAPMGTPVQALGAGTVTRAGRYGEDGNMVGLRHSGSYQTLYLHLSRILVHVGERVAQGQTIGLVGMTGLATGPHLDFRIEHNGTFQNFEVLRKSLPPAAPVSDALRPQFEALRSRYLPLLNKLQPESAAASAPTPSRQ